MEPAPTQAVTLEAAADHYGVVVLAGEEGFEPSISGSRARRTGPWSRRPSALEAVADLSHGSGKALDPVVMTACQGTAFVPSPVGSAPKT